MLPLHLVKQHWPSHHASDLQRFPSVWALQAIELRFLTPKACERSDDAGTAEGCSPLEQLCRACLLVTLARIAVDSRSG